jgi:hypothetical protein
VRAEPRAVHAAVGRGRRHGVWGGLAEGERAVVHAQWRADASVIRLLVATGGDIHAD